jgi:hypothetical protein
LFHRAVEDGVGNRKEAHEEKIRALRRVGERARHGFAEKCAGERSANEFVGLVGCHRDDRENGNPAAKFFFAEQGDRFADAVNFATDGDEPGIQIAKQFVDERGIALEEFLDGVVAEIGRGDEVEESEAVEFIGRNFAGAED